MSSGFAVSWLVVAVVAALVVVVVGAFVLMFSRKKDE